MKWMLIITYLAAEPLGDTVLSDLVGEHGAPKIAGAQVEEIVPTEKNPLKEYETKEVVLGVFVTKSGCVKFGENLKLSADELPDDFNYDAYTVICRPE